MKYTCKYSKRIVALLVLLSSVPTVMGQSAEYVKRVVCELSDEGMYGRSCAHKGDSLAAEYIAGQLREMGVKPLAEGYMQKYLTDLYSVDGECSLSINGRQLKPYDEFRIVPIRTWTGSLWSNSSWQQKSDGIVYMAVKQLSMQVPIKPSADDLLQWYVQVLDSSELFQPRKIEGVMHVNLHRDYVTQNVCGYIEGESDSTVVFTAHYDHLGMMGDKVCFHGAHDNASGVASVLGIAKHYSTMGKKPHYTTVFMLFSGEEAGLQGSKYAVEHPLVDLKKTKLVVNLDLLCGGAEGIMIVNGKGEETQPFVKRMQAFNEKEQLLPEIKLRDNAANSDHWWFSQHCPAIFIYTLGGRYGDYHSPYDTCDKCGIEDSYEKVVRVILNFEF
ncbi:MAG: M28 family peptidase [Bacteroidales bacterium]|nr:M28 family peptidase [Bacteroidales bacterium]